MRSQHQLFIYRPLETNSATRVERLQEEYASIESFYPIQNLHMTILSGQAKRGMDRDRLRENVMHCAPIFSEELSEATVASVQLDYRSRDITRLAIKLMLDDIGSEQYFEEHEAFKSRLKMTYASAYFSRFTQPHVTIGYLDVARGITGILNPAEELVGTPLSFAPTRSNVGQARANTSSSSQQEKA